jgi:hypothetical protein
MIRYALRCEHGHGWEAWFDSISSYDAQQASGLVECPVCGSTSVEKAPMAPAVVTSREARRRTRDESAASDPAPDSGGSSSPGDADGAPTSLVSAPDSLSLPEPVRAALDGLREHVRQNFDYVGDSFAREARAIHEGDSEPRQIYGEATAKEARDLLEDGITVAPLPGLATPRRPRDLN